MVWRQPRSEHRSIHQQDYTQIDEAGRRSARLNADGLPAMHDLHSVDCRARPELVTLSAVIDIRHAKPFRKLPRRRSVCLRSASVPASGRVAVVAAACLPSPTSMVVAEVEGDVTLPMMSPLIFRLPEPVPMPPAIVSTRLTPLGRQLIIADANRWRHRRRRDGITAVAGRRLACCGRRPTTQVNNTARFSGGVQDTARMIPGAGIRCQGPDERRLPGRPIRPTGFTLFSRNKHHRMALSPSRRDGASHRKVLRSRCGTFQSTVREHIRRLNGIDGIAVDRTPLIEPGGSAVPSLCWDDRSSRPERQPGALLERAGPPVVAEQ